MSHNRQKIPSFQFVMVSFDMMPKSNQGLMQKAVSDLSSQLRKNAKERRIIGECDSCRVDQKENYARIEFLDTSKPEKYQVRLVVSYALANTRF